MEDGREAAKFGHLFLNFKLALKIHMTNLEEASRATRRPLANPLQILCMPGKTGLTGGKLVWVLLFEENFNAVRLTEDHPAIAKLDPGEPMTVGNIFFAGETIRCVGIVLCRINGTHLMISRSFKFSFCDAAGLVSDIDAVRLILSSSGCSSHCQCSETFPSTQARFNG